VLAAADGLNNAEIGAKMSLDTAYRTLHRLGYSCQSPRPRHENHDPEA